MGTGDYICITLRGGAPWGFSLREGDGDTYTPFHVYKVQEGGAAFLAGVKEGDEVVSLNGEPCVDLDLRKAFALIKSSTDCLQLLLKRYCSSVPGCMESEGAYHSKSASPGKELESTTLHILSSKPSTTSTGPGTRELYISEYRDDETYRAEGESATDSLRGLLERATRPRSPGGLLCRGTDAEGLLLHSFSPGVPVTLQVSLSDDRECTSLGSALGIEGLSSNGKDAGETLRAAATHSLYAPSCPVREPLGQRGVVLGSPSLPGQVELTLRHPGTSVVAGGRGVGAVGEVVGGPGARGSIGSRGEGKGAGGGHSQGDPASFSVSFAGPSEEATAEEEPDSDSEGDPDKPNKHRARHARLRRSESLSEKQVKEAKSKCKRIALLLTAAPPNANNKGLLMFKRHRQRSKKYTLVSYGTRDTEPKDSEDEEFEDDAHTVEFTLVATSDSELDKNFFTDAQSGKGVLTINWDKGLLEIERNLYNQEEMECLPETKGKGALMFAQRRQRVDEITAEHEEMRRQGIPVEGIQETEKKAAYQQEEERSYMQATAESQAYMDVTMHQQSQQQQQQYQQYQEQQYYEQQQQQYQQQQQQQLYQQQQEYQYQQRQQYEQQHSLQQQTYQQQQQQHTYQQQQIQQYSANMNGTVQHQTNEVQSSFLNQTAKPFSAEHNPYSTAPSGTNQDPNGQGEQIASRDERIATPAIRTGVLQETRKKITGKPMFTFKDAPKVSPNPVLLNLLNRNDKKLGFESGPEEDYLSLGAEACNFLQSQSVKHKTPPPVAPKPVINPTSPPWSQQIEIANQDQPQLAENSVTAPAVAPTAETTPAPELEPTDAPAAEPSPPLAPQDAPANIPPQQESTWSVPEPLPQPQPQPQQVTAWEEDGAGNSPAEPTMAPVNTWAPAQAPAQEQPSRGSWAPAQVQPPEPAPSQSPAQLPWVTPQSTLPQVQPPPSMNNWATPQAQPLWGQSQEPCQSHANNQPPWAQPQVHPQSQPQSQPPWAQEQAQPPQVQPPWAKPQEQAQPPQVQPPWANPQEQAQPPQVQPPWAKPQEQAQPPQVQPPWAKPQEQAQPPQVQPPWHQPQQVQGQPLPPWVQQPQMVSQAQPPWVQQADNPVPQQSWPQGQPQGQPQPPWLSSHAQPQQQPQDHISTWPPSQPQHQVQPPWIQATQTQPQASSSPWAPAPAQAQPQPAWAQQPQDCAQPPLNPWGPEHSPAQPQPPWSQPVPAASPQQQNWQQPPPQQHTSPKLPMSTWSPAPTQPQAPANTWTPQPQQTHANASAPMANTGVTQPSPKLWHPPQGSTHNTVPPSPPRQFNSYTASQRSSSPINPMASVLNPSGSGSSGEMQTVRGKGADLFAKRQSRMERFIVDSETVQANKASRSASPAASLPTEWKYSPNVRAPPPLAYNRLHSPFYPPAAVKQQTPSSPSSKAKKKEKEKQKAAPKPLNVVDVMKHRPYQLNSSLFTYGPAAEAAEKAAALAAPESEPTIQNAPIQYEQMAPVQPSRPNDAPYPQQVYGAPLQPFVHEGHFHQAPVNAYPPANLYQPAPGDPYHQAYNPQYQQGPPHAYQPQTPQTPIPPYQHVAQVPYQPANSPPYLTAPTVPYQPEPPTPYLKPSVNIASRPDSASGGNAAAAPKPRFTAKKTSAQVWKPTAAVKE